MNNNSVVKLNDTFFYKRKYFVSDLMNKEDIISKVKEIEFDSFESFVKNVLKEKILDLDLFKRVIIPITSSKELEAVLSITNISSRLAVYFKEVPEDVSSYIKPLNIDYVIDSENIEKFKEIVKKDKFIENLFYGRGIVKINFEPTTELDQLSVNITDPFFIFPYFNNVQINWNIDKFENLPISSLKALRYHLVLLRRNVLNTPYRWNCGLYGFDEEVEVPYKLFATYINKANVDMNSIYFKGNGNSHLFFDKEYDPYKMSTGEISSIREWYDYNSEDLSYIDTYESNFICMGSPIVRPYISQFIEDTLSEPNN